jgi:cell division septum initiation protein DivIVA
VVSDLKPQGGRIDETAFSTSRKGFDKAEVIKYLRNVEENFQDLESWTLKLRHQLEDAEQKLADVKGAESGTVDTAMVAVFDTKDRIIERANANANANANAEAQRTRDQAEVAMASKMREAERMMAAARSEVASLQKALAEGDDDGAAAARLAAAEAERLALSQP